MRKKDPLEHEPQTERLSHLQLSYRAPWLVARFAQRARVVSWALLGGGLTEAEAVAWLEVKNADLPPELDPKLWFQERLRAAAIDNAVGLLTSRRLDTYVELTREQGHERVHCVATVGLGNALRAGDPQCTVRPVGTINVLCHVSTPLSDEALLEALALATEAKTLAVREAHVPSIASGGPASGTGTDCVVIASPAQHEPNERTPYAGKHTLLGHLIGDAVHAAVCAGATAWKDEQLVLGRAPGSPLVPDATGADAETSARSRPRRRTREVT